MNAHVFGDGVLGGEFGDPERPGDVAAGIGHAPQGHAEGPPADAVAEVEAKDATGEEDIQHRTHGEEMEAVIGEAPGIGEEQAGEDGNDAGDPGDVEGG